MSKTRGTATTATAVATALTILCTAGAPRPTSAQGPEADPHAWYEAVRAELEAGFETMLNTASENEAPAGLLAQVRMQMEGILANLDTEMNGIEARIRVERAEHDPKEDRFCRADIVGRRLLERVGEDPADAQDALLAGVQCRTAYRGAVSIPATEEIESLRDLCFIARDRIVEHHDNPEIVFEPARAALYAVARCAAYRGAASVAQQLTGTAYGFYDADHIVRTLTNSFLRGEFTGP